MLINWVNYNISDIISGKDTNGVRLLELFLKDYKKEFNVNVVNASCQRCLQDYLNKYKQKKQINIMASQYKLKKKYENIPLTYEGEGYNVMVNNNNITDDYARILLKRYPVEKIFDEYPLEENPLEENNIEENYKKNIEILIKKGFERKEDTFYKGEKKIEAAQIYNINKKDLLKLIK